MSDDNPERTALFINGAYFKDLIRASLTWLKTNQEAVNALNVFPVPDGDTGTNMVLTLQAAYDEMKSSEGKNVGSLAEKLAHGALMGARGNSGVILSQIWRGFSKGIGNVEVLDGQSLVKGLVQARDTAYKGVVRPVEGTILTVCKDSALAAQEAYQETNDPREIIKQVTEAAEKSVNNTPELLDVLKEAGVVDAGGKGLLHIFEGMVRLMNNQPLDVTPVGIKPLSLIGKQEAQNAAEPGQDYEVIVDFKPFKPLHLETFYDELEEIGTSIQVGEGEGIYRMHIHVPTEKRYEPIDYTMTLGTISKVHIENLMEQTGNSLPPEEEISLAPVEPGQIAVVAVSPGIGFTKIFASLGAASIVEGGQTMNPSTEEILTAAEKLPTDKIIILPNNKNILMAAQSAAELADKDVRVIETTTLPQGLSAMLRLIPGQDMDKVTAEMKEAVADVESGAITTAVRSVEIDGIKIAEGEIISLHNGSLVSSEDNLKDGCFHFLKAAQAEEYELITLFYGENISQSAAEEMAAMIQEEYPDQVIELQFGGQPHYQFIISIE